MRRNDLTSDEVRFERLMRTLDRAPPAPHAEFLRELREASTTAFLAAQANRPQPHRGAMATPTDPAHGRQVLRLLRVAMLSAVAGLLLFGFLPPSVMPSRGVELHVALDNLRRNSTVEIEVQNGLVSNTLLYSQENGREQLAFTYPSGNVEVIEGGASVFVNLGNNSSHPSPTDGTEISFNLVGDKLMASLNVNDPQVKAMLLSQRPRSQREENGDLYNYYQFQTPAALSDQETLTVDATVNATTNSLVAMNSKVTDSRGKIQFEANADVKGLNRPISPDRFRVAAQVEPLDQIAMIEEVYGNAQVFDVPPPPAGGLGGYPNGIGPNGNDTVIDSVTGIGNHGRFVVRNGKASGFASASGLEGGTPAPAVTGLMGGQKSAELTQSQNLAKKLSASKQMESTVREGEAKGKRSELDGANRNRRMAIDPVQDSPTAKPEAEDLSEKSKPESTARNAQPQKPATREPQMRAARTPAEMAPAPPAGGPTVGLKSRPSVEDKAPVPFSKAGSGIALNRVPGVSSKDRKEGMAAKAPATPAPAVADDKVEMELKQQIAAPLDTILGRKQDQRPAKPESGQLSIQSAAPQFGNAQVNNPVNEMLKQGGEYNRPQMLSGKRFDLPRQNSYQLGLRGSELKESGAETLPFGVTVRQAEAKSELRPGGTLRTGADPMAVVRARLANDANLIVGPGSEIMLLKPTEVRLRFGELAVEVPEGDQVDLLGPELEFQADPENSKFNYRRQILQRGSMLRRQVTGRGVFRVEQNQLQEVDRQPEWLTKYYANYGQQNYQKGVSAGARAKQSAEAGEAGNADRAGGFEKAAAPQPAGTPRKK